MTTQAISGGTRTVRDGCPAPRWAVRAAHLAALTTIPSGLWRVALAMGFGLGWGQSWLDDATGTWTDRAYLVGLSLFAEGLALLTLGLVQPWGEIAPGWIPFIGGRRVPPFAAIVPAALGAAALTAIWAPTPWMFLSDSGTGLEPTGGWEVLMAAAYLPLMLWGPLLAAVTWSYYRRRCRA